MTVRTAWSTHTRCLGTSDGRYRGSGPVSCGRTWHLRASSLHRSHLISCCSPPNRSRTPRMSASTSAKTRCCICARKSASPSFGRSASSQRASDTERSLVSSASSGRSTDSRQNCRTGVRRTGQSVRVSTDDELERRKYAVWYDAALRAELVVGQERRVAAIEALLFERDPIGINHEENTDEYRPEAQCIVIRLAAAHNEADANAIVYDEFAHWFGITSAGPRSRYEEISRQIWTMWQGVEGR